MRTIKAQYKASEKARRGKRVAFESKLIAIKEKKAELNRAAEALTTQISQAMKQGKVTENLFKARERVFGKAKKP